MWHIFQSRAGVPTRGPEKAVEYGSGLLEYGAQLVRGRGHHALLLVVDDLPGRVGSTHESSYRRREKHTN